MGNITSLIYSSGGGISYTYDQYSRVTSESLSIGNASTYEYNADSLVSIYTNGRGEKTSYSYDALGRITSFTDELGTVGITYDGNGNILVITETDNKGNTSSITRTYDCMNRVTSYTDCNGNTVKYGYDEIGNLISLTYPGGEIVRYSYDKAGLLSEVTDEEGNITGYTYDSQGRLITTTKPDKSIETNSYDQLGRLVKKEVTVAGEDGNPVTINSYGYTYDEWGNIISISYEGSCEADSSVTSFTTATMTYDECNRMLTYNGEEILYDEEGNMTYGPLNGEMTEFEYDCRNRLIGAGDVTYEYNAENVRTATETPEYREEYVTDSVSELPRVLVIEREYKNVQVSDDENESNQNDISWNDNQGLEDIVSLVATVPEYIGVLTGEAIENIASSAFVETETYYYGIGLVYEKSSTAGILIYHYDHLGSTTAITDKNGELVYGFTYGTYGELNETIEYSESAPRITFLYNGQLGVSTDENGLYYMTSRYYNPEIKRFIKRDILTGNIGITQA